MQIWGHTRCDSGVKAEPSDLSGAPQDSNDCQCLETVLPKGLVGLRSLDITLALILLVLNFKFVIYRKINCPSY